MQVQELEKYLKQKMISIPVFLLQKQEELGITLEEFVFLMYLKDNGEHFSFDPKKMSEDFGVDLAKVMQYISVLTEKKIITVEAFKNEKGILEEEVSLENFYKKYLSFLVNTVVENKDKIIDSNLFEIIEKEFGRTLSPSEIEFIKAWITTFDNELIVEAVKEASLNGVSSIRYIDKILYDWDVKGIKKKEDVEHFLSNRVKKNKEVVDVFDYDWFLEDEEE